MKSSTKNYIKIKSILDFLVALMFLLFLWWLLLILIILASIDTTSFGVFFQERIGYKKEKFIIYKIKTYRKNNTVSWFGKLLRKSKLDETPQIINILKGEMSFVGPRPDITGFADNLEGEAAIVLTVKPGVTGPASILFKNEEYLLQHQKDTEAYNKEVIWPKKVELNIKYVKELSFKNDIYYLIKTFLNER